MRLDETSVPESSSPITSLLMGLSNGQKFGWGSNFVIFCLFVGAFGAFAFISQQLVSKSPLLNLRLFANRNFALASIVSVVFGAGLFGSMFAVPLFLQTVRGLSPTDTGLAMLPAGLILTIVFPVVGYYSDKIPAQFIVMLGMALLAYGTGVMAYADHFTSFLTICWWLALSRIGMAMVMPPLSVCALSSIPVHQLSQAAATSNFVRQTGGALGVNLISVILDRRSSKHLDYIASLQHEENTQTHMMISQLIPELHQSGVETAFQEPLAATILIRELYQQAISLGFQDTFIYLGILLSLGIIPAYFLRGKLAR